tara:strand:- start:235 stop:906 length:672 start_codon:yes stop_codon:yes gene_type:complete
MIGGSLDHDGGCLMGVVKMLSVGQQRMAAQQKLSRLKKQFEDITFQVRSQDFNQFRINQWAQKKHRCGSKFMGPWYGYHLQLDLIKMPSFNYDLNNSSKMIESIEFLKKLLFYLDDTLNVIELNQNIRREDIQESLRMLAINYQEKLRTSALDLNKLSQLAEKGDLLVDNNLLINQMTDVYKQITRGLGRVSPHPRLFPSHQKAQFLTHLNTCLQILEHGIPN